MRSYMEKNEPTVWWIKPLKIATVILASIAAMMLLTLICSLIILNSKLPGKLRKCNDDYSFCGYVYFNVRSFNA